MADTIDLKSIAARHTGSNPVSGTICGSIYTYVLGLYLGDGYIAKTSRAGVYRLSIFQDSKYTNLINQIVTALRLLFPNNKVSIYLHNKHANAKAIVVHSSRILQLFPQHGSGLKCNRSICLTQWQQNLVNEDPRFILKGLIQSDGSRYIRSVANKKYMCYNFTNTSPDILKILKLSLDLLNISWTEYSRPSVNLRGEETGHIKTTITVAERSSVQVLDSFIGAKT